MDDLNCKFVREDLWNFEAQPREDSLRPGIAMHLDSCRDCEMHYGEVNSLRTGLQHLPVRQPPSMLTTRLRVLASKERARQTTRRDFRSWLTERVSRARLSFDNLLKPFAVPAAGGLLASFLCFGVIVDTLHYVPDWQEDIPIGFTSEVEIGELSPFDCKGQDVMVQLTVDSMGHVTDYMMPHNNNPSSEELQEVGNLVMYSTFTPAMRLGRPISSKRLFSIRHISVKG
jgi:hypothetical protein